MLLQPVFAELEILTCNLSCALMDLQVACALLKVGASVGFKAMGDAVVVPVAKFIAQKFLLPLAKFAYNVHESDLKP